MLISMAVSLILSAVKNPQKAKALETQLLEVADAIYLAYGLAPAKPKKK